MPIKKKAVKIKSSVKTAVKASVKAKNAVKVSHSYGTCKKKYGSKKKAACKPVKSVCNAKKSCKKVVRRRSAFRANASQIQTISAVNLIRVAFGEEVFDLGREYNPATSTFRAKQSGVYTFFASVFFSTADPNNSVEVTIVLRVNGATQFGDTETIGLGSGVIDTSGIVNLRQGDDVQVEFIASTDGIILPNAGTHFDGALLRLTK